MEATICDAMRNRIPTESQRQQIAPRYDPVLPSR